MVSRCMSPYMDGPFIWMYEKVDYQKSFSVMVDYFCRLLDTGVLINDEIKVETDLCRIDFPFDKACFFQRAQKLVGRLEL